MDLEYFWQFKSCLSKKIVSKKVKYIFVAQLVYEISMKTSQSGFFIFHDFVKNFIWDLGDFALTIIFEKDQKSKNSSKWPCLIIKPNFLSGFGATLHLKLNGPEQNSWIGFVGVLLKWRYSWVLWGMWSSFLVSSWEN